MFYWIGLKIYDLLSGSLSIGKTESLSKIETIAHLPSINTNKLVGGILYYDGQFDDSQLAIEMAATAIKNGATVLNYCKATGFIKNDGKITGVECVDTLTGKTYTLKTKTIMEKTEIQLVSNHPLL